MKTMTKTTQLQIRVSPAEKSHIHQQAKHSKMSVSEWVLSQILSVDSNHFQEIVNNLASSKKVSFEFAELNDFLSQLPAKAFERAVSQVPQRKLEPYVANYLAAMVEEAASKKGAPPPNWTKDIPPLSSPRFATELESLRLHLLTSSPVAFRRRNIFIDTSIGGRV